MIFSTLKVHVDIICLFSFYQMTIDVRIIYKEHSSSENIYKAFDSCAHIITEST